MKSLFYFMAIVNLILGVVVAAGIAPTPSVFTSALNYLIISMLFVTISTRY